MTVGTSTVGWHALGLPVVAGADTLRRHVRVRRPGEVNLKSCELLHPAAQAFYAASLRAVDPLDVIAYPLYERTIELVGAHLGVPPDHVLVTPGSDSAIALLVAAFGRDGRLLLHDPAYEGWHRYATLNGTAVDRVPPGDGGEPAIADLVRAVRASGPAIVVLTQPSGTTGATFGAAEIEALAAEVDARNGLLVIDTCYLAFTEHGEETVRGATRLPGVIRVNSFSKTLGMAGGRLAALVADAPLAEYLARWQPEGPVSGLSLALLRAALGSVDVFERIWVELRATRAWLATEVAACLPNWRARPSGANFVTFDVPTAGEAHGAQGFLLDNGIRVRDLSGLPGLPAAVRLSLTDQPTMNQVVQTLHRFAAAWWMA